MTQETCLVMVSLFEISSLRNLFFSRDVYIDRPHSF